MNKKILVKLFVPAIELDFDIWIPPSKKIYHIIKLLEKALAEFLEEPYEPSNNIPLLYDKQTGKAFDINLTVKECGINNGTQIILI